ncbi:uncharacterized protein E0L32_002893 [Thyridium curvatum]|uniref:Uncharacterized protein n=1 Tax=Thyridium curvatum TaxID=1093900 RepID=A0A507B6B0_9PEZI|nr:uncharacterized protein E0L32_002893 [Thyridium curvatum]TPX17792.1 hypothetical protein E0L32_002893 [Thyridium curvatum]
MRASDSAGARAAMVREFNNPQSTEDIQVFVSNIRIGAVGFDFHECCCKGIVLGWPWSANIQPTPPKSCCGPLALPGGTVRLLKDNLARVSVLQQGRARCPRSTNGLGSWQGSQQLHLHDSQSDTL